MLDINKFNNDDYEEPGEYICFCYYKTREQIINAIKEKHLKTVAEVGEVTRAGTNCGGCQGRIKKILEKHSLQI